MLNVKKIKQDFPIFNGDHNLVYLDSTATSLKPKKVIESMVSYYSSYSANIYRGVYKISEKATLEYESTREVIARFINANSADEVIFTRNTTESLNLVAYALGRSLISKDDEVVTTIMEHHSNFVPWQQLAFENQAVFKIIDVDEEGHLLTDPLDQIINRKTKIVAMTYISNVLGTINPVKKIVAQIKQINPGVIVIIDGAQAVPHKQIDVQDLGCDFFVFSSHKMLGPTGIGVLWGKYGLLEQMMPFNLGGEMITEVKLDYTGFKKPPHKFEAGTPHIAGVIALKHAVSYLKEIGLEEIARHEHELCAYTMNMLKSNYKGQIHIIGPKPEERAGIIAFTFGKYHPHDIAQILDDSNICIRAGHHCAMPLHNRFKLNATARASIYLYNDKTDINKLADGLEVVQKTLR